MPEATAPISRINMILSSSDQSKVYFDPEEEKLQALFARQPASKKTKEIARILNNSPSWPLLIHLSPQRQMLLNWFPFASKSSVLEIGAGCGALTGLLLDRCRSVTSVELSPLRAEILRTRYSDKSNLIVETTDIAKFSPNQKFDYVTAVGVLEYAGVFFEDGRARYDDMSFTAFLNKCLALLKPNGTLLLAIENQWGLKYVNGEQEDHYDTLFESLNEYPHYNGTRTFGKQHLTQLLEKAGFRGKPQWYFPFPDYKLPLHVISESWLLTANLTMNDIFPSSAGSEDRPLFFNQTLAALSLKQNQMLSNFANSFLVVIKSH